MKYIITFKEQFASGPNGGFVTTVDALASGDPLASARIENQGPVAPQRMGGQQIMDDEERRL